MISGGPGVVPALPGPTGVKSDAQRFLVDVFDPSVGPVKTIARAVDLLLGEILDYEEVLSGVVRFAQFAVSCNHVCAVDHEIRIPPTPCGIYLRPGCITTSPVSTAGEVLCCDYRRRVFCLSRR